MDDHRRADAPYPDWITAADRRPQAEIEDVDRTARLGRSTAHPFPKPPDADLDFSGLGAGIHDQHLIAAGGPRSEQDVFAWRCLRRWLQRAAFVRDVPVRPLDHDARRVLGNARL